MSDFMNTLSLSSIAASSPSPRRQGETSVSHHRHDLQAYHAYQSHPAHHAYRLRRSVIGCLVLLIAASGGCKPGGESAQWLINGLLDPTQQGQFLKPRRNEIRASLSILEEPIGIQDADEPRREDLAVEMRDHRIIPGDVLSVSIFELLVPGQASTLQLLVSTSGFESLPTLGRVRIAGFTLSELEMELKERLREADILPDPEVQVSLLSSRGTRFSIMGSVPRAGSYEVPHPDYRLLQALADAGGVSPAIQKLYVFRKGAGVMNDEALPNGAGAMPESPSPGGFTFDNHSPPMLTDVSSGASSAPSSSAPSSSAPSSSAPSTLPATSPTESQPVMEEMTRIESSQRDAAPSSQSLPSETRTMETPAPTGSTGVDELEILERGPTVPEQAIIWDPDKGWVITPTDPAANASKSAPSGSASSPSGPGTSPAGPGSGSVWPTDDDTELASPVRIIEIPVKELLAGDPRYNIVIRPFDLITIPPGAVGEFYMMGNIARPGAYDITGRRMTVKEAIASAGGFGPLAWPSRADLIRRISQDEEQIIQLDLDAIFAGNAPDFYLRPNDIVNIGTTAAAPFLAVVRNAFRFSYGLGFVYDRNFADVDTFQARLSARQFDNQVRTQQGRPIRNFSP